MKLIVVLLIVFIGNAFSKESRCFEEIQPGPCMALIKRYAYDKTLKRCVEFEWGGCQPNGNNFETFRSCMIACHY